MTYREIKLHELNQFNRRELRPAVLEKLKERISNGFNPARPLTVVDKNGSYIVADGNHRLHVLEQLGFKSVACVIREGNEYQISIECNSDEETYAPEDLFDRLATIAALKEEGYTQAEIGDVIGMGRESVKNHNAVANKIGTQILDLCKQHQEGRGPLNGTIVPYFNFTEGWFRNSGLYDLNAEFQHKTIERFIDDKFNWNRQKIQKETARYKLWQDMIEYVERNLHDKEQLPMIRQIITSGAYSTMDQLKRKLEDINVEAENKLINGDCLSELENIPDGTIDLVITDPPYGIDYKSNKSKFKDHITKEGLANDDESAADLFDQCCKLLSVKSKENAHFYFFIDVHNYPKFRTITEKYFDVRTPLIWYKSDGGIGDLKYDWINGTEMVIYATKGSRPVNKRRVNVLQVPRLHSNKMIHPTEKPTELIKQILEVSAHKQDIFCDPFMGSGSHIAAAKEFGCRYIGIELDGQMFEKAKARI